MSWWKRQQRDEEPEPRWETNPGEIAVYATHESGCVSLYVSLVEPSEEQEGEATVISIPPELAYQLAQRITLAAIKLEEGKG